VVLGKRALSMIRIWLAIAGIGGLASVIAGAFAAHLADDPKAAELLRTGALYIDYHPIVVTDTQENPAFGLIAKNLPKLDGLLTNVAAVKEIACRIPDLLRLDLGVVLVGGWKKIGELRGYTDAKKYAPEETIVVELTKHTIVSSHKPTLDIIVNDVKVDTLPFELKLTVTLDGALLTIRGGKTVEVVNADAEGRLVMADGLALSVEDGADAIVTIATLTGAAMRTFGSALARCFGLNFWSPTSDLRWSCCYVGLLATERICGA
jgi:hypothetical protein